MTEDEAISELTAILKPEGFTFTKVPRIDGAKSPDLEVRHGSELYLIEQKSKGDDPSERDKESEDLKSQDIITRAKPLKSRNAISTILSTASKQIEAHPKSSNSFKVVWITVWGVWHGVNFEAVFKSLYGSHLVFDANSDEGGMQECLYLGYSDFHKHTELDAVVVLDSCSGQLFVNEFSPRYDRFISSKLAATFRHGTYDPRQVVEDGDAYSLKQYNGSRGNKEKCLEELSRSLGVERMIDMPMSEIHAVTTVKKRPQ